ncbi:alpha/beta hydrolase [Citrobacter sp. RHB25-C09]|uniref:alpha/beta fold hydrolase n=1 Tax=Citrobacter sp. RHB25-C09 TaxID=2742624 RepID=UPI0015EFD10F|nr:alpha/beta hydrolase [Citrobacter sp. RHB25-C09]QMI05272.1 alpha/beta hydrolase [Citrobacter sp. RHB25-C09]
MSTIDLYRILIALTRIMSMVYLQEKSRDCALSVIGVYCAVLYGLIKQKTTHSILKTKMISILSFQVPFQNKMISAESTFGNNGHVLMLHGGGKDRTVFNKYRALLDASGIGTTTFDFIGHGETGGELHESSLFSRTLQAEAVLASQEIAITGCMGVSMGAYNALQLTRTVRFQSLILMVPGVYSMPAYKVKFGPDFSAIIRKDRNWEQTDAWDIAAEFTGDILIIAAENDSVIPAEIPEKLFFSASRCRQKKLMLIPGADHNTVWDNLMLSDTLYENVRSAFVKTLIH